MRPGAGTERAKRGTAYASGHRQRQRPLASRVTSGRCTDYSTTSVKGCQRIAAKSATFYPPAWSPAPSAASRSSTSDCSSRSRGSAVWLCTAHRTTPCLSTMYVERRANPPERSSTPYASAVLPCGQKSESNGKSSRSASANARRVKIGSHETASTCTSSDSNDGNRSRTWHSSPVHTLLKAYG